MKIEYFDNIDSTNTYFKNKSALGMLKRGDAVVAWSQGKGRGRLGRGFYSPLGGIYLTVSYGYVNAEDSSFLSLMPSSALCLSKLFKSLLGIDTVIKWPNDILFNSKKLVGILAERTLKGDLILGVGINYEVKQFDSDIESIATSIYSGNDKPKISKEMFAPLVAEALLNIETFSSNPTLVEEYNKICINIGEDTTVKTIDGKVIASGICKCIDENGAIVLQDKNGTLKHISSGEITLH